MSDQIGFVGVGNQGGPMAMRIVQAGLPLTVWARRPEALADYVAAGAVTAPALGELGAGCDLVAVCVVSDGDVREVVLGENGLLTAMRPGSSLAIHSTVHPDLVRELAVAGSRREVSVLDAPVSGGSAAASAGRLAVMAGGEPEVLERWRPVMTSFASTIELLGPVGTGQLAKLVNNAMSATNLATALHAAAAAAELGLDKQAVQRILEASSGDSFMLKMLPMMEVRTPALAAQRYRKDVDLFRDLTSSNEARHGKALWAMAEAATAYMEESS